MNRTELVDAVAAETGLDRKQAEAAVKALSDAVIAETKSGEKVSIFGFGTFTPTARAARMGRNPQTNTPVKIAASKGVRFSPAAAFKTTLNSKKAAPKKTAAKKAAPVKATKAAPAKTATTKKVAAPAVKKTVAKAVTPVAKKATPVAKKTVAAVKKTAPAKKATPVVAKATKAVKSAKKR